MHIDVITERSAAEALRPEWDALVGEAPDGSVFLSPEWLLSWWDAYGDGLGMHLVAASEGGRLRALFPLAFRGRRLQGWSNEFTDRSGPLVAGDSREAVEAVARHLADIGRRWRSLDLRPLSEQAAPTGWTADAMGAVGIGRRVTPWMRSPIVDLPEDPAGLDGLVSRSFAATLRRKGRKAEAAGLTAEMHADAAAAADAFAVSEASWAHREGTGIASTAANRAFYTALAGAAASRGWLRIALLREPGGRPVAFEWNLLRGDAAVNLKLGYREDASGSSPGQVLRPRVMEALVAEGARTFDLLGSDEPYKMHWAARTAPHVRIRAFPPTPSGRARHVYRNGLRPAVGRVLRAVLRRADGRG